MFSCFPEILLSTEVMGLLSELGEASYVVCLAKSWKVGDYTPILDNLFQSRTAFPVIDLFFGLFFHVQPKPSKLFLMAVLPCDIVWHYKEFGSVFSVTVPQLGVGR